MTNNFMPNLTRIDEKRLRNGWIKRQVTLVVSHTSSFLRFSENSFCRKPYSSRDLTPCVAVVLSVSLLATKTPVLRSSLCVGHDTAKPREHGLATDAFFCFFRTRFPWSQKPVIPTWGDENSAALPTQFITTLKPYVSSPCIYPVCI